MLNIQSETTTEAKTRVRNPMPITQLFLESNGAMGRLNEHEERELARAWRENADNDARNKLIEASSGLVVGIARGLSNRGIPLEELIAEGNIGLIRAVDRFDPEAGCRLSTFAFRHIRHAMTRLFAKNSLRGRLSNATRRKVSAWETASGTLAARLGESPSDDDVAIELGWSVDEVARARRAFTQTSRCTLQLAMQETYSSRAEAMNIDSSRTLEARQKLQRLFAFLDPRERQAMELLHGINMPSRVAPDSVARIMHCSTAEVLRLRAAAQGKLMRHRRVVESAA